MSIKEYDLYEKILATGPFKEHNFFFEIEVGDWAVSRKRIDLVTRTNNQLIGIEVKVADWKTSLKQAYSNLFAVDYSYVAVWHDTIPKMNLNIFEEFGIGVLAVNGTCDLIQKARKSHLTVKEKKKYVKKQCEIQEILLCQS